MNLPNPALEPDASLAAFFLSVPLLHALSVQLDIFTVAHHNEFKNASAFLPR
jgi:hypothetical protein